MLGKVRLEWTSPVTRKGDLPTKNMLELLLALNLTINDNDCDRIDRDCEPGRINAPLVQVNRLPYHRLPK
jgi:hypothetical protein